MTSSIRPKTSNTPLKIALFVEGETDNLLLQKIVEIVLADRRPALFRVISPYQPINNLIPDEPTGWRGVFRRIIENKNAGGGVFNQSIKLRDMDVIIIHMDLDVTWHSLPDATDNPGVFTFPTPCHLRREKRIDVSCLPNCSRLDDDVHRLRHVLCHWIGEDPPANRIVFWNPAQNAESWVVSMRAPRHPIVQAGRVECYNEPEIILSQLPKKVRIEVTCTDYKDKVVPLLNQDGWRIGATCRQARRFIHELKKCFRILGIF